MRLTQYISLYCIAPSGEAVRFIPLGATLTRLGVNDAVHVLVNAFDGISANLHLVPPVGILAVADVALNDGG